MLIREVLLKLTESCPCKCPFCEASTKYKNLSSLELTDERWIALCYELIDARVQVAILSGGEPFVRKNLVLNMIKILRGGGIFVVLNTSGALFSLKNNVEDILKCYPDLLVFSVDSADESKHDANRRLSVFRYLCSAIKTIKNSGDYPIAIRTVVTRNNYRELPSIISKFYSMGVDCIKLTHIENDYDGKYLLSEQNLEDFIQKVRPQIITAIRKFGNSNSALVMNNIRKVEQIFSRRGVTRKDYASSNFAPEMKGAIECPIVNHFITIQSDGVVLPCCEAEHHGYPKLGNINDMSFGDVIHSKKFQFILCNRQTYCQRCTEFENLQLNFNNRAEKVSQR